MAIYTPSSVPILRGFVANAGDTFTFLGTTYTPVLANTLPVGFFPAVLSGALPYVLQFPGVPIPGYHPFSSSVDAGSGTLFQQTYPGGLLDGNIYWEVVS